MAKLPEPVVDVKEKIYNLYHELVQAKKDKKETMKAHTDNIKRIEDELKDVLADEEEEVVLAQKAPEVDD